MNTFVEIEASNVHSVDVKNLIHRHVRVLSPIAVMIRGKWDFWEEEKNVRNSIDKQGRYQWQSINRRDSVLLAALLAQTERLRIVATFTGSGNFLTFSLPRNVAGGNGKSKSAAAFGGTTEGNELQLTLSGLLRFFGRRNDDLIAWLADRLKTEGSLGDFDNSGL